MTCGCERNYSPCGDPGCPGGGFPEGPVPGAPEGAIASPFPPRAITGRISDLKDLIAHYGAEARLVDVLVDLLRRGERAGLVGSVAHHLPARWVVCQGCGRLSDGGGCAECQAPEPAPETLALAAFAAVEAAEANVEAADREPPGCACAGDTPAEPYVCQGCGGIVS